MLNEASDIGENVRAARQSRGWSLRKLASEAEVSPSLISQIENGHTNPSVRTLHSLAEALSLPITTFFPTSDDQVVDTEEASSGPSDIIVDATVSEVRTLKKGMAALEALPLIISDEVILRADARPSIELQGGVTWNRLTNSPEKGIEFLESVYEVGATSGERMSHHAGREFGVIIEGELTIEIGFDTYVLNKGDSVVFDSSRPHRLTNNGERPMKAIWVVWHPSPIE